MNKFLVILFLLTVQLFSLENVNYKAKQTNDFVKVKFKIKNPMIGREQAAIKNVNPDYITKIIIKSNEQVIYEVFTTPNISKNPVFKFHFKNKFYSDNINCITVDNKNNVINRNFVKQKTSNEWKVLTTETKTSSLLKNEDISSNKQLWNITNIEEAIKVLYGDEKFTYANELEVTLRTFESNSASIPINIKSDIKLESLAIFQNKNKYSTIAIIKVPSNAIVDYSLYFKMDFGCDRNIVVIGKGINGKIYRKDSPITVLGSDMNCDGAPNGLGG